MIGIGVLVSLLLVIQKDAGGKYTTLLLTAGGIFLLYFFLERISPVFSLVGEYMKVGQMGEQGELLLKALAVGYLIKIGGDTCRDLGAEGIAAKLELCGRAELLLLSLPLLSELIATAFSLVAS